MVVSDILGIRKFNTSTAIFSDQKPSGTHGGSSGTDTEQARELNTEILNAIDGLNLSSNSVTIEPGLYYVSLISTGYKVESTRSLVKDQSGSTILHGLSGFTRSLMSGVSAFPAVNTVGAGLLNIEKTETLEIDQYTWTATANIGLGLACASGDNETYTIILMIKYS